MDTRYAYSVGRIRAKEARLLSFERLLAMLEAEDVYLALKELVDTDYSEGLASVKSEDDFDHHLSRQMESVLRLISELSYDPQLTDLFVLRNDAHNLKLAIRRKHGIPVRDDHFLFPSLSPLNEVFNALETGKYGKLCPLLQEIFPKIEKMISEKTLPPFLDALLDKEYLRYCLKVSLKEKSLFLSEFFSRQIDITNIRTFLRLKAMHREAKYLERLVIDGGRIEARNFQEYFDHSYDEFLSFLRFKDYYEIVKVGLDSWEKEGSFFLLEKLADDYLIRFVRKAKYITFGIEPLIGYLVAKDMEIKNLRIIVTGKFNQLPGERIKTMLRETYIGA